MPRLAALFILCLAGNVSAQRGIEALTLEESVTLAVKNSPAALAAEQDIIIARQRMSEARFTYLPQFTLSGTASRVNLAYPSVLGPELGERYLDPLISRNFYTLRANALQPVYTGGKNANTLKLARTSHNQARVNYETVKADVMLEAKRAFYTMLYRRRLAEAAGEWLARAEAAVALFKTQDPAESLENRVLLAGLESRARQAASGLETATTGLLKALNREPGYQVAADGVLEPLPVKDEVTRCLVTAMESRSDLKSELYRAQMDEIAVNMAMIRRSPTVYMGASYDISAYRFSELNESSVRSNNWLASLAIHFPLSYDIWTQVRQRKAQQRQGELKRVELQDKIRFEILVAHKEALFWQREAEQRKAELERIKAGYKAAAGAVGRSAAGLRAIGAIAEFESGWLEAVYNQLMSRIRLEWAQGRDLPK
ncbi:MAG: hypothetical protein A2234_02545 [Elusimicrobia bacterium RIFOXYA2_FULL_58_8]|nr:MAG: hypothetical protein A2285_04175 [Elusimicrobia bacterium RIFOXYA12_FULL_57_11]OGS13185.1 MAG: hypothetical protein A2234_02545 [Elusimicrobia bacterium RIFOXYA2_FULL_58_8]